jgi:hypothetical protein
VAEGGGLLNRCRGLNLYPGFESLPHRHPPPLAELPMRAAARLLPDPDEISPKRAGSSAKADESLPHRQLSCSSH